MLRARISKIDEHAVIIEFIDGQSLKIDRSLFKEQIKEGDEIIIHIGATTEDLSKAILNTLLGNQ